MLGRKNKSLRNTSRVRLPILVNKDRLELPTGKRSRFKLSARVTMIQLQWRMGPNVLCAAYCRKKNAKAGKAIRGRRMVRTARGIAAMKYHFNCHDEPLISCVFIPKND